MRDRREVLKDILGVKGDLNKLEIEISQFPWDSEEELILIDKENMIQIIDKVINGELKLKDLEQWANLIECRDDIGFENETIKELIFRFANQEINGEITIAQLVDINLTF